MREQRDFVRREAGKREALRIARQLHALTAQAPPAAFAQPITPAATQVRTISPTELVQLGARAGVMVTADVILASQQLTETKYYFYDPEGPLLAETESTTGSNREMEWEYVWFGDEPVAQIHARTGEISYYFNDHLGTPIIQTNQAGQVIWHAEHEPFGRIYAMRVGEGRYQPLRAFGQIADIGSPEPDVYYNVHRYYRSSWGRYTQPDPLFDPAFSATLRQWHPAPPTPDYTRRSWYEYANNNPLSFTDPLGLQVKNNANCRLYVKPEGSATPVPLYPGQEYPGNQDGYVDPCKHPGLVFKTVDGVDVTVGADHDPDTSGNFQLFLGGWKDSAWNEKLKKKKDYGWDPLFKKNQCLCCATTP